MRVSTKPASNLAIIGLIAIVFTFLWLNIQWLQSYRFDQSLDIDEAGYITYAVVYAQSLVGGGIKAWLHAINGPGAHGPVVPAITSIILALSHIDINHAFFTNPLLGCIVLGMTFLLTLKLSSSTSSALIATLIVATTPGFIDYARAFQFAMQAGVCYIAATLAIINSQSYTSKRYAILAGVALGVMIMSRTMTIAFLPAFALASLLLLALEGNLKNYRSWAGIGIAVLAFFLTALTWYAKHYKAVFDYLFSFGYGAHASEYGKNTGFLTIDNILSRIDGLLVLYLRPIHFYILASLIVISFLGFAHHALRSSTSKYLPQRAFVAALVIFSFMILASSRNRGSGFEIPIIAPMSALLMASFSGIAIPPLLRRCALGAIFIALLPVAFS